MTLEKQANQPTGAYACDTVVHILWYDDMIYQELICFELPQRYWFDANITQGTVRVYIYR